MRRADTPEQVRRDPLTFDRDDHVGLTLLLWVVAIASVLFEVGLPLVGWLRGSDLTVPYQSRVQVPGLDAAHLDHGTASYDLSLTHVSTAQRLLDLVPGLLLATVIVLVVAQTIRLMRRIAAGDPFGPGQVGRLRSIGALLLVGVPVVAVVRLGCTLMLLGAADLGSMPATATIDLPWSAMLAGLFVALLAEAFQVGRRLREDVDGLV